MSEHSTSETDAPATPPASPSPSPPPPPPPSRAEKQPRKFQVTSGTAFAAVACIFIVAAVLQNLWRHGAPLLGEAGHRSGLLPLLFLMAAAGVVALIITVLIFRHLKPLLLSVRMTAALLVALALLCGLSAAFVPEEVADRGRVMQVNDLRAREVFSNFLGKAAGRVVGDKVIILARTGGLTCVHRSWALVGFLAFLGLSSAAGLLWRRPMGAREFGFWAAHLGVILVLGGLAAGALLGSNAPGLEMGVGGAPVSASRLPVKDAPLSVAVREIVLKHLTPEYRVWAIEPGGERRRLALSGIRPGGRTGWGELTVEVEEFRPDVIAERYLEDAPDALPNPVVNLEVEVDGEVSPVLLYSRMTNWYTLPLRGVEFRYDRLATADEADAACRRERGGAPEELIVLSSKFKELDRVTLDFGRAKVGRVFTLPTLGLRLKVIKYYAGAELKEGKVFQVPAVRTVPPALRLAPAALTPPEGEQPKPSFWIFGSQTPTGPIGSVPIELKNLRFVYNPSRWQPLSVRVVEGPAGSFRLALMRDGKLFEDHPPQPIAAGEKVKVAPTLSVRLLQHFRAARPAYRPGKTGQARPACRLSVSKGAIKEDSWFFPGLAGRREILGAGLEVEEVSRGPASLTVEVEAFEKGESVKKARIAPGRPLEYAGYRVHLVGVKPTSIIDGKLMGKVTLAARRDPGMWAVYIGMALLALGAPWLLWSRFRSVPDGEKGAA